MKFKVTKILQKNPQAAGSRVYLQPFLCFFQVQLSEQDVFSNQFVNSFGGSCTVKVWKITSTWAASVLLLSNSKLSGSFWTCHSFSRWILLKKNGPIRMKNLHQTFLRVESQNSFKSFLKHFCIEHFLKIVSYAKKTSDQKDLKQKSGIEN